MTYASTTTQIENIKDKVHWIKHLEHMIECHMNVIDKQNEKIKQLTPKETKMPELRMKVRDGYYNQEGLAFNAGLETLDRFELLRLVHFMKATTLVDNVQQYPDPRSDIKPGWVGVGGYEATIEFDFETRIFTVTNAEDLTVVETLNVETAVKYLTLEFNHELSIRMEPKDTDL